MNIKTQSKTNTNNNIENDETGDCAMTKSVEKKRPRWRERERERAYVRTRRKMVTYSIIWYMLCVWFQYIFKKVTTKAFKSHLWWA